MRQLRCLPYKKSQIAMIREIDEVKKNQARMPFPLDVDEFWESVADL
jgi:hypothetical protein